MRRDSSTRARHALRGAAALGALALALALALAATPATRAAEPARRAAPAGGPAPTLGPLATRARGSSSVQVTIPAPLVRVGLTTDAKRLTITSPGGFYLVDPKTGRDLWRRTYNGEIHVVLDRRGADPTLRFMVQVASLSDPEEAEELRKRIETETGEPATVSYNPDRRAYRVRVGQAPSRPAVATIEEKVRAMGFSETWIVEETVGAGKKVRLRLVDEDYNDLLVEPRTILALPSAAGRSIEVDGVAYRGVVEVGVPGMNRLRAVNVVNLEDYLRGVVPLELGPTLYPEVEALKAQAVAARTYAVANEGQFVSEGFDVCDTPRCQVYGGTKGEDPLTDRAIAETSGMILTVAGKPINALYTATCGGHTEDVQNVFREDHSTYLKGVSCYPEETVLEAWRRSIIGAPVGPIVTDPSGEPLGDALSLLSVLGVIDSRSIDPNQAALVATQTEIAETVRRALGAAGKSTQVPPLPQATYPTAADLARYLVAAFGWQERVGSLLDDRDVTTLLGGASVAGGAGEGRKDAAYLIKEGIYPPKLAPGDDLLAPASRSLLYRALHRMLVRYDSLALEKGIFRGSRGSSLIVINDADEMAGLSASREIEPAAGIRLARDAGERVESVPEVSLSPGDRISWHAGPGGKVDYLRLKANLRGASDDRFTAVYQWEVRMTRKELQDKIKERASIGELIDVVPGKRGVSGRLLDVTVVGSAGKFTFRGFPIRTLLGLRETLFVVDRQRDADGRVASFIFAGKGWGHGVGLCQVGSFGMALRGAKYDEILKHYYTGITIEPVKGHSP